MASEKLFHLLTAKNNANVAGQVKKVVYILKKNLKIIGSVPADSSGCQVFAEKAFNMSMLYVLKRPGKTSTQKESIKFGSLYSK